MKEITLIIFLLLSIKLYGQDTIRIIGPAPWHPLIISPADTLNPKRKIQLDSYISLYRAKKDVILSFIEEYKKGTKEAIKILKKDKQLKKLELIDILVPFEFGRYNELNILYKPIFKIEPGDIIISCTIEQLNNLDTLRKKSTDFIYRCKYLGELFIADCKIYELIDYEVKKDN